MEKKGKETTIHIFTGKKISNFINILNFSSFQEKSD
jgi:hypothetical protein